MFSGRKTRENIHFICDSGVMIEKERLVPGAFSEIYFHPLIFRNVPYISGICELQQRSRADTPGSKTRLGNN